MRREFSGRDDLIEYLKESFPEAVACDGSTSEVRGGRTAAEEQLRRVDPARYASTRNYLDGAVTRLSPYIRHGVLSLAEVRDFVLSRITRRNDASKLITELGWREYWQRLYARLGDGIWRDRESYKTGFAPSDYSDRLPDDIVEGRTGLVCIDQFSAELRRTGYLHNHARMWMAAYIVHWRHIGWQAGARWFLTHLLDGDPASNNLSWQWVAGTFSHKPYFFNRENLERFTGGKYCNKCPLRGGCDFEGDYDRIAERLFPNVAMDGSR